MSDFDSPDPLADLIAFDADGRAIGPANELKAALHQHLHCPLFQSFHAHALSHGANLPALAAAATPPIYSLADLLRHPAPPIDLLWMAKDFAKITKDNPHSPLPPELSLLLYYGSITAALLRCQQRITKLSDDRLRSGLSWAARQPWLDETTRALFLHGLDFLRSPRHLWRK